MIFYLIRQNLFRSFFLARRSLCGGGFFLFLPFFRRFLGSFPISKRIVFYRCSKRCFNLSIFLVFTIHLFFFDFSSRFFRFFTIFYSFQILTHIIGKALIGVNRTISLVVCFSGVIFQFSRIF